MILHMALTSTRIPRQHNLYQVPAMFILPRQL
jgi:hypothetical protein